MRVLVACEESQDVCKAFRAKGHEAYSCDIQPCSGGCPEWHIQGDVLPLLNGNSHFITEGGQWAMIDGRWDLIIAHPPCTYLTSAGATHLFRFDANGVKWISAERYKKMREAVCFFNVCLSADCQRICVENPAPMHICELPKYSQTIEPYEFGHPWKKRTCLWLKGLPPLRGTVLVEPTGCWTVQGGGKTCRIKLKGSGGARNAKERAKTFPGIAKAMAEQWG